jgi:hypothetical protein
MSCLGVDTEFACHVGMLVQGLLELLVWAVVLDVWIYPECFRRGVASNLGFTVVGTACWDRRYVMHTQPMASDGLFRSAQKLQAANITMSCSVLAVSLGLRTLHCYGGVLPSLLIQYSI